MDSEFFLIALPLIILIFLAAFKLAHFFEMIFQPISLFVTQISAFVLWPFTRFCNFAAGRIKRLVARLFPPRKDVMHTFGGISMVIRIGFFLLFSIFTVICIAVQSAGENHLLEESIVYEMTPLAVFQLFSDEEGGSAAMFAPILFSLASVAFMKSTDGLHVVIRWVYDFIFNCFFFCLLFWAPEEIYTVLFGEGSSMIFELDDHLGVLGVVLQVIAWIALIYISIVLSALSLRETLAVLAFSLVPLVAMIGILMILTLASMPAWLYTLLVFLVILTLSVWMFYRRDQSEGEAMEEYESNKKLKR